jgi:hypothetical protein
MKNYTNIIQLTPEWHEMKWGKIGGTLSAGLLIKTDTLFIDILSQRLEDFEMTDSFSNFHTERGLELEPFAVEFLEQKTGLKFRSTGWLQCEENELLGISPDGITEDEIIQCEIKCLSRKEHLKILLADEIPSDKINQLVHAFLVNPKLKELHFFCYRPESVKHFHKILTRDSIVDLGFKKEIEIEVIGAKGTPIKPRIEKVKDLKNINECCKILRVEADILLEAIKVQEIALKDTF